MAAPPEQDGQSKTLEKFPRSSLIAGKPYGQGGGFGMVISGTLDGKFVVVKILHNPIAKKKISVLQQMFKLEHRNLIRFLGIIDLEPTDCPQLVFKNANKGNLLEWLRNGKGPSDQKTLHKFSCDIINGMEYLHSMEFIHGSLAARNILIDEFVHTSTGVTYINAKLSDYGMTRVMEGTGPNYYKMTTGKSLPIRWMPKEAILTDISPGEVTLASDVWSFAVLLWEMWTKCDVPYGITASNSEVRQHILDGSSPLTFHRPAICPEHVVMVMKNIFKINQDERPTFVDLRKSFDSVQGGKQSIKTAKPAGDNSSKSKNPQHSNSDKDWRSKPGNPKNERAPEKRDNPNEKRNFNPNQKKPEYKKKPEPKKPNSSSLPSYDNIAPPPYSPTMGQPIHQGMPGVGYNPQQAYAPIGTGMQPFPQQQPVYYPQQPMNMGMPFPYGANQMPPPPPPYAVATSSEAAEMQAQTIRDLQNKISSMEVKQLEDKVNGLQKQQRRQQKPQANYQKTVQPQKSTNSTPKQRGNGQQGNQSNPLNYGHGQRGDGQHRNPQNYGNYGQKQQGQGMEIPGWMPIAGAAIAGMAAGVAAAAAASNSKGSHEGRGKKK